MPVVPFLAQPLLRGWLLIMLEQCLRILERAAMLLLLPLSAGGCRDILIGPLGCNHVACWTMGHSQWWRQQQGCVAFWLLAIALLLRQRRRGIFVQQTCTLTRCIRSVLWQTGVEESLAVEVEAEDMRRAQAARCALRPLLRLLPPAIQLQPAAASARRSARQEVCMEILVATVSLPGCMSWVPWPSGPAARAPLLAASGAAKCAQRGPCTCYCRVI